LFIKSDIEIAQETKVTPITEIAAKEVGVPEQYIEQYGCYKAKVDYNFLDTLKDKSDGKLIFVTAINPTPAGEGNFHMINAEKISVSDTGKITGLV